MKNRIEVGSKCFHPDHGVCRVVMYDDGMTVWIRDANRGEYRVHRSSVGEA